MKYLLLLLIFLLSACSTTMKYITEKQITNGANYHHDLDNNDNFSPDNQWLVYDTRTDDGGIAESGRIEKVNISTGEKKIVYEIPNNQAWGPGVGAVSYSPVENAVVFIHGLPGITKENPYQQWRRTGVIIDENLAGKRIFMDARDITAPYTKGALRGGTHRHEWSGDGQWIGYTYNDAVMKALEDSTGEKHNLRTIGVSKKINPIVLEKDAHGDNISGEWYSVLVVKVTPNPKPGSDEISHAAGDSWVGTKGYTKPDGSRQMARAFIGTVKDKNGKNVDEVFIVDIPDAIDVLGESGPLEGTATTMPMPPKGTIQRRLTHTADTNQPGCVGIVRSSPDGQSLAFLAKDDKGILQIFTINPDGKNLTQLTYHPTKVEGFFRWHPSGKTIYYVWNGAIVSCETGNEDFNKRLKILTEPTSASPSNLVISHDGKIIAFNRLVGKAKQVFIGKL
jgi:WD40 repeat protein